MKDDPRISGRLVRISKDGTRAYYVRPRNAPRHPEAAYTVPHRTNKKLVVDVILLALVVLALCAVLALVQRIQSEGGVEMSNPWEKWEEIPPELEGGAIAFPTVQWENQPQRVIITNQEAFRVHLEAASAIWQRLTSEPLDMEVSEHPARGGFFIDANKYTLGECLGWPEAILNVGDKGIPGHFGVFLEMSVLAYEVLWESKDVPPVVSTDYRDGFRRRVRLLGIPLVDDRGCGLSVFTSRGRANDDLVSALGQHAQVAYALPGNARPFMFRFTMFAGEVTMMGRGRQRSPGTPIVAFPITAGDAAERYVGDEVVRQAIDAAGLVEAWRNRPLGIQEEQGQEENGEAADPLTWAREFPLPMKSKRYPKGVPLGRIADDDPEYARRLFDYILDNPDKFSNEAVRAAFMLLQALREDESEDEIPV